MLFEPTHKTEIIKDTEYNEVIVNIEKTLEQFAQKGTFPSFDEKPINYEFYKTTENRASIVIVHGFTEFLKKYYELTWYFLNMGFNVFLFDLRGHGYSYRSVENTELTHIDYFEDYAKDLDCYINNVVIPNSADAPVYLFAHSLGGGIATYYLGAFENKIKKAILSSPLVYPVCTPLPRYVLRALLTKEAKRDGWSAKFRFTSDFKPDANFATSSDQSECRFRHNLNMRINDINYRNSSSSNRWNYEILGIMDKILDKKLLSKINSDVLVIAGGKDTVVKLRPQKRLVKKLGCKYICFEDAKHSTYTMVDKDLEKFVATVLDYYIKD